VRKTGFYVVCVALCALLVLSCIFGARFFAAKNTNDAQNLSILGESGFWDGIFKAKEKSVQAGEPFDFSDPPQIDAALYSEAVKKSRPNSEDNFLRASFSTSFATSSWNRKQNIKTAAKKLDGVTVFPDEVFSFNQTVGDRTAENGFLPAPIILDGKFVTGVGGGVCQVSSTLYNCALLADLEILSVKQHSMTVGYISASFDAMVSSKTDLVFVNSTASPIKIKATATDSTLTIGIYGDMPTRTLVRRSQTVKIIPAPIKEVEDNSLPVGTAKILSNGKTGLMSKGYLDVYENGKLIVSKLIRKDSYIPQERIVAIGTKPVSDKTDPEVEG
jgi:hypothetical protein